MLRTLLAVAGALLVGGIAVTMAGLAPLPTFVDLVQASVGSQSAIKNSLLQSVPITLTALGVALAFRARLFNLGGDGQIYIGALGAVAVAMFARTWPALALLPVVLLAGCLCGCAWGAIAGLLRARLGLSEIITTIMLNFIGFWIVSYMVRGPIKDPAGSGYPYTPAVVEAARLPLVGDTVPVGILITLLAAIVLWLVLERSRTGLEIKATGESEPAARFAGIRVDRHYLLVLATAGALGGLAGASELLGNQYRLSDFFSPNWGFDAVAVALIGRGSPIGTLAAGLFVGSLESGTQAVQATAAVPASVAKIVQGVAVLFLIVANADLVMELVRKVRSPFPRRPNGAA